ncbi:MAG TPA: rhodanese-like domain-containing protein, partial [Gemmataceae bacterium]|nr:rhodanese-like domain-containing protein [Gemmataceae bacterium]
MAQHSPAFLALVTDAKRRVRETTVDQVKARLDRGDKLIVVDVREDNEWVKDHVPGAVHLGKGIIERDAEAKLPDKGAEIILYCGGGFR